MKKKKYATIAQKELMIMAYQFSTETTASFKLKPQGKTTTLTIKGINSSETSAQTICNGVASLLACAQITGVYENAERVKTEDVYDDNET